jgi:hypothetical protein
MPWQNEAAFRDTRRFSTFAQRTDTMTPNDSIDGGPPQRPPASQNSIDVLNSLITVAVNTFNAELDAFTLRLVNAFLAYSESATDGKDASVAFRSANLLKNNAYAFYYLASGAVEKALKEQLAITINPASAIQLSKLEGELSLVPLEVMDQKLRLANMSRPIEIQNANPLNSLNIRLGHLLGKESDLSVAQNPFRPETFLTAINKSWMEFDPDTDSHSLLLPLLEPSTFIDLGLVFDALNNALISRGILPELNDAYRIKKSNAAQEAVKQQEEAQRNEQLRRLLMPQQATAAQTGAVGAGATGAGGVAGPASGMGSSDFTNFQQQVLQASVVSNQLIGYLAGLQKTIFDQQLTSASASLPPADSRVLADIKAKAPRGALTEADENAIDLLIKVFEVVFSDRHVPTEVKPLIGLLQVPVLKAALLDKEFFFQEEHPARRLIELMTKASVALDQKKGKEDPLYKTIQSNVNRVQKEYDQQISVFSDVVTSIEKFIKEEERESTEALSAPISEALRQEKIVQSTKAAKQEVAMRIGTGEVVAFVETFLENKWVPVLTLAYSIKEEKPQALESAIRTMDDLIWSVKPKITMQERKELIAKLPSMLAALNKWLNVVKLDDAERVRFFAELSETHASIVRAPLELTPQRQLEIAMEVAKKAAERRREKLANRQPEPTPDAFAETVHKLERGTWFEFAQKDGSVKKVRLAWVSPLRSLYIFSTRDRQESFSMSSDELAQCMRENRTAIVMSNGVVDRALAQAFEPVANDPVIETQSAA